VESFDLTLTSGSGKSCPRKASWLIGVANSPFSASGDSGSLVFDREGKATGLLFAGKQTDGFIPDISHMLSLKVVLENIEHELGLTEVKLANAP